MLQSQIEGDYPGILIPQGKDLRPIPLNIGFYHGPAIRVQSWRQRAVLGKTQSGTPGPDGPQDHLFRCIFPISIPSMGVKILQNHLVIFSCFTLWSMTWREASSFITSSTEIPISTISTITWYMRSAIS